MTDDVDRIVGAGASLWNAGRFFECHDRLEEAWRLVKHEKKAEPAADPRRDLVHGIILCAAAYVHWRRGNALGVERKLADARTALARTPLRALAGRSVEAWLGLVLEDLARGAKGSAFDPGRVPPWPL